MLKVAWESEEARENAPPAGWIYQDRPVARRSWEKVREHPIEGLSVYRVRNDP